MTTHDRLLLLPLSALLLLLGAGAPGCGGTTTGAATVESVCTLCGASGSTLDGCIKQGNSLQAASEKAGCADQFQAYIDCAAEKGTCEGDELTGDEACKAEFNALDTCGVHL
jgi:hypothetical protein